jgi:hypothetical protein
MTDSLVVQIEEYRSKAKDLRARAGCVSDPLVTDELLRLADEYERLAARVEDWSRTTTTLISGLAALRRAD